MKEAMIQDIKNTYLPLISKGKTYLKQLSNNQESKNLFKFLFRDMC